MNLRNSRPIPNSDVYRFIKSSIKSADIYDLKSIPKYCDRYVNWILDSKNDIINLDRFKSKQYVHGTSQAFDFFYLSNHDRRMRTLKGDFMYHQLSWRHNLDWKYIEDGDIEENDAVIFSLPFSDSGDVHPLTNDILDRCDELKVPVFLDCAYMIIAKDISFDFDRPCVRGISFSMSKGFYGAEKLRIGLRLTREYKDDSVEVFNSMQMLNTVGVHVGLEIMKNFEFDYNNNKYKDKQIEICEDLEIKPSKCVLFGNANQDHPKYGSYDRGTEWRRVCISSLLGDMKDLHYI